MQKYGQQYISKHGNVQQQILSQLCNPHSLNLKQLKQSVNQFTSILVHKQIISIQRYNQIKIIESKPKQLFNSLSQQEIINLLKWQLIIDFFISYSQFVSQLYSNYKTQNNQNKKLTAYSDIYKVSLKQFFNIPQGYQHGKQFFHNDTVPHSLNLNLKKQFKYVCFQIIAFLKFNCYSQKNLQTKYVIQNEDKIFYFVDAGQILQKSSFWNELQNFYLNQRYQSNEQHSIQRLIIETLQFESINSSLRFASQLLIYIINENKKQFINQTTTKSKQKSILIMVCNLNKIIYYLRVLKRNHFNIASNVQGSQDVSSNESIPIQQQNGINSKRSIHQKKSIQIKGDIFSNSEIKIQPNYTSENQNQFLNQLEDKTDKLIQKLSSKYKQFTIQIETITSTYQPLSQILMLKNTSSNGSDYASNFSMKKFKLLKFNDDQKKLFFIFMAEQLKNIYKTFDINQSTLYNNCKQTFLSSQQKKKIQNQIKNQQNKNVKAQVMQQMEKNLNVGFDLLAKTNKTIDIFKSKKFLDVFPNKNKLSQSKKNSQSKEIYFPTLKPKMNLQVQNRLKLKQIKQSKKVDQSFFIHHKTSQEKVSSKKMEIKKQIYQTGGSIISSNKINQSYKQSLKVGQKLKSTSLPSKIKINTNYTFEGRFGNLKSYENTKSSILDRKFSYEMIICQRQNGNSLNQNNLCTPILKKQNNELIFKKSQKRHDSRSKLRLKNRSNNKQSHNSSKQSKNNQDKMKQKQLSDKKIISSQSNPLILNRLAIQQKKKNTKRRDSLVLRSSIDKIKRKSNFNLITEPPNNVVVEKPQRQKSGRQLLTSKKNDINFGEALVKSINVIIQNCKNLSKVSNHNNKSRLKIQNRISFDKRKTTKIQDNEQIVQQQQSRLQNLKYEDASQTLTSLQIYFRALLQVQKYKQIRQDKYRFYVQLQRISQFIQNRQKIIFRSIIIQIIKKQITRKRVNQTKDKYYNTFKLFIKVNQQIYIVQINQKYLILNPNVVFQEYFYIKICQLLYPSQIKSNLTKHNFSFKIIGDLGGHLQYYQVKFITIYQLHNQQNIQLVKYKQKTADQDQTFKFSSFSYHNPQVCQLLGLKKQKHTVDSIVIFVTKKFSRKSQLQKIQNFVKYLFFNPLNQYILDWGTNTIQKTDDFSQQFDMTCKLFSKEQKRIYHIYFLNRSYEMHSKYKYLIKKLQSKYPSFSYEQFERSALYLSNEEKQFSQNVELYEYLCRNLIVNKKYVLFNIKILQVVNKNEKKDYLMIQQKNSNFGDHRLIFFVFPLKTKIKFPKIQLRSEQTNVTQSLKMRRKQQIFLRKRKQLLYRYYSVLMNNIGRYHSLNNICDFLIANEMIQNSSWFDTMFNKLLLTHPHITVLKKIYIDSQQIKKIQINNGLHNNSNNDNNDNNYNNNNHSNSNSKIYDNDSNINNKKRVSNRRSRKQSNFLSIDGQSIQYNSFDRYFKYATIKVFIFNRNNLVLGIVELSGQSFFFVSLFDELNQKIPKYRCKPLSRNFVDKYRSSNSSNKKQYNINNKNNNSNISQKINVNNNINNSNNIKRQNNKKILNNPFTINKIINSQQSFKISSHKIIKKNTLLSSKKIIKTSKSLMNQQQQMANIKQRFISLFKHDTQLSLQINFQSTLQPQRKRMTIDNYQSRFKLNMKIQDQPIKVMQTKYYWPDTIPQTGRKCVSFRLRDDSLMLIKLNKDSYYMRKSNKIKIHYFQNYLKLVSLNKLKCKGNAMNELIKKQDKLIYYDAYKLFVQQIQKYYYTFSVDNNLLIKIKLGISPQCSYLMNVVDLDIDVMLQSNDTPYQDKDKLKQVLNFEIKPQNLSIFHIQDIVLNKKMLNNKRFRKRIHCLIKDQLDSILRKF